MKNIRIVAAAAFAAIALFIPCITVSAETVGETVSQNTAAELRAVKYENNETIVSMLAPSRYLNYEISNKKLEISNRDKIPLKEVTDEQAKKELNQDNVKAMSFEESFAEVQANIDGIIQKVVDSTDGAESKGAAFYTKKILQNK